MKKITIISLLFLFNTILVFGGEPLSKTYTSRDYNAHPLIWNIVKDPNGNLWMANNEGVLRFDGNNWNLYPTPKPVRNMAFDEKGNLFLACEGDLGALVKDEKGIRYYYSFRDQMGEAKQKSGGDKNVHAVNGEIYFTSSNFVIKVETKEKGFEMKLSEAGDISGSFVWNEKLYVNLFNKGLGIWNGNKVSLIPGGDILKGKNIVATIKLADKLLIGSNFDGLYTLGNSGLNPIDGALNTFARQGLAHLSVNSRGEIAIGTFHQGVQVYDAGMKLTETLKLPSNEIYTSFYDEEDNLWVAHRKGLTHIDLNVPIRYFPEFALSGFVSDMRIKDGKLYIATSNGLYSTSASQPGLCTLVNGISGECWALSDDYIASTDGLISYSGKIVFPNETFSWLQNGNLKKQVIYAFGSNGCYTMQSAEPGNFQKLAGVQEMANSVYENPDGSLWVGTYYNGLQKIPSGKFNPKDLPEDLSSSEVIIKEKDGKPLFACKAGVYNLEGNSFVKSEELSLLYAGAKNRHFQFGSDMWVISNTGLRQISGNKIAPQTAAYLINGRPTAFCEYEGKIWFAFEDKIYLFNPGNSKSIGLKSLIGRISNGAGEVIYEGGTATLEKIPFEKSGLHIEFGINSFLNPEKNLYRYKLGEQWSDWQKESFINLNQLAGGNYSLEMEARAGDGNTGEKAIINFQIQSPWYQSIYAYLLYSCLLVLFTFGIIRLNSKVLISQNKKLEKIVGERTKQLENNNIALQAEKKKSDDLLLNILPGEIADELKTKGSSEAKLYNHVTVLFTDFVNFTGISEQMSPTELVQEIHRNFTAFDAIMDKHGLEKIKTIGDAYLAVCGLPNKNDDHALRAAAAALDIQKFMLDQSGKFQIRIGMHSGAVVAGIVGVRKYAYDIWGDTVNMAARMEQSSEAGKINISGTTYSLISKDFECDYRGKINAKNKGEVDMYFVNRSLGVG